MVGHLPPTHAQPPQVCPVCCATPLTRHEWANGTLRTDTYTDAAGHIWQVRWTATA